MREHALPQDVTGYKFHIIGNMTLKQFAEVAVGFVVGFFIYQTNLLPIIKWPAILLSAGIGAFTAFIPFEEQPFDHWIMAFWRALYRPTQFYWKRSNKIPEPFLYKPNTANLSAVPEVDLTPARLQRVKEFLHSVRDETISHDSYDQFEMQKMDEVLGFFSSSQSLQSYAGQISALQESMTTGPVDLPHIQQLSPLKRRNSNSAVTSMQTTEPVPRMDIQLQSQLNQSDVVPALSNNVFTADVSDAPTISLDQQNTNQIVLGSNNTPSVNVVVPQAQSVSVSHVSTEDNVPPELAQLQQNTSQEYVEGGSQIATPQALGQTLQNAQLPFPEKPTEPNKVVGMVLDMQNTPLPGVIVEIVTPEGFSARAVKTNLLGQFFITTPLNNGVYTVVAEKDGLQFTPTQLVVNGTILDPIEVRTLA